MVDESVLTEVEGSDGAVPALEDPSMALRAALLAGLSDLGELVEGLVDDLLTLRAAEQEGGHAPATMETSATPIKPADNPVDNAVTFVELGAGTAALTFALFGGKPPVPFAGSKRSLAKPILAEMGLTPGEVPARIHLVDPSEWGRTLQTMKTSANAIADVFETWYPEDQRELFDRLRNSPPDSDPIVRAATHLYLQTRTYRGKPVYVREDGAGWITHGFDPEHRAEAVNPGSHVRGWFNSRPQLAKKLRALALFDWSRVTVHYCRAQDFAPIPGAIVFCDPPYQGTLGYGPEGVFSREDVIAVVLAHQAAGCTVYLAEAEDMSSLLPGWYGRRVSSSRHGVFKSTGEVHQTQLAVHEEWLTSTTPPVQEQIPTFKPKDKPAMSRTRYFRHVVHARSSVKGGVDVELAPKTLIVGPNASLKDRITQSVALALTGAVHDLGGKDVRQPVDLLALAPKRVGALFAHATLDDGAVATFRTRAAEPGKSTGTEHILPPASAGRSGTAVALLAVSEIREVLTRKGDDARRQFFLDLIGTGLSDERILEALPGPRHEDFKGLAAEARQANGQLRGAAVLTEVIKLAKKRKSEATGQERAAGQLLAGLAETAPMAPSPEALEAARQRMDSLATAAKTASATPTTRSAGPSAEQIDAWQAELDRQIGLRGDALTTRGACTARLAALPQGLDETTLAINVDLRAKWRAVERMASDQIAAVEAGAAHCALCNGEGRFVDSTGTVHRLTVALDPDAARAQAAKLGQIAAQWYAHIDQQEAASKARAEALATLAGIDNYLAQVNDWIGQREALLAQSRAARAASEAPADTGTSTLLTEWQEAQRAYQALQSAYDGYQSVQRARTQKARAADEAGRWDRLVEDCEATTSTLLGQARGDFVQAVQDYMPDAEKMPNGGMFDLRLTEGNRQVCQVGLLKDGEWHTALSGAEWVIVTTAIACVLARQAEITVVLPEDRDIDPETLANVMRALTDAPCQILWCTTKTPKGRTPAGWTVLEAVKVPKGLPEDAPFALVEPADSAPGGGDDDDDDAAEGEAASVNDGAGKSSPVLEVDSSALPNPEGAPAWWTNRGPAAWRGIFDLHAKLQGRGEPFAHAFLRLFPETSITPTEEWVYEPEDGQPQRFSLYANGAVLRAFTPTRTTAADGSLGPEPEPFSEGFLFRPAEVPAWATTSATGPLVWTGTLKEASQAFQTVFGTLPVTRRAHDLRKGTWRQYENGAVAYQSGAALSLYQGTARLAGDTGTVATAEA